MTTDEHLGVRLVIEYIIKLLLMNQCKQNNYMSKIGLFFTSLFFITMIGCATQDNALLGEYENAADADGLYIVDCLLPGQFRKLGQYASYVTARRPIKTTASDCGIRGGDYVAYDRADYRTALNVWMPKAQSGNAEAQAYVGEIYEKGLGLTPNYETARLWYLKAAEQGNTRAQISLGYLYEKGLGVPKDLNAAFDWYKKSSGFDKANIPYAATLESSSDKALRDEITFLKTELKNSRNETKNLQRQLTKTQLEIQKSQQKLLASRNKVENSRTLLQNATKNSDTGEMARLQKIIAQQESEINNHRNHIASLENQYQKKLQGLNIQLDQTQKRAAMIAEDLKQHKSAANQSAVQLLEKQAALANTEKRLYSLKQQSLITDALSNKNLSPAQQADIQLNLKQQELASVREQLQLLKQEKQQQQNTIERLKKQSTNYQGNIAKLNRQLQSSSTDASQINHLQQQLQEQKQAVADTQKMFKNTQNKLALSEAQYDELLNISAKDRTKLKQLEKLKLAANKTSKEVNKRLQQSDAQWQQQQALIRKLEAEKLAFEQTINKLQKNTKIQTAQEKPDIEIIDPPFVLVRGVPTVTLRSVVKQRDVIGKVSSNAGVLSLMVNDKKNSVDEQGLFTSTIGLKDTETPVKVVAVDKKGQRSTLDFILSLGKAIKSSKRAPSIPEPKKIPSNPWKGMDFGKYHALIIGNSKYSKVPVLDTPKNDARALENVLKSKYGFKTKLLLDGTRYQILSALNKLRSELNEKDNLLIYYAGHGELDKVNMRGHWLPVDADPDNTANWISTVAITDILNTMSVKHVLVVSDSCYSGAMTRSSLARLEAGSSTEKKSEWLKAMLKARSRTVMTSGGLKPVMDGGGGKHSVFANAFIRALKNNNSLLEGQALYRKVSAGIVAIAAGYGIEQVPEYAPIRHAGHESGEFFFKPRS